jgi:hypothetical protein
MDHDEYRKLKTVSFNFDMRARCRACGAPSTADERQAAL